MTDLIERLLPISGQVMLKDVEFESGYSVLEDLEQTTNLEEVNAITSKVAGENTHKIIIDVDFPVHAIPSSTPGHSHLYIDKAISWERLTEVIGAFANAGIVEQGYLDACLDQGFTTVRAPWVKKGDPL